MTRKALGKGLSALLPDPEPGQPAATGAEVPLDLLDANPYQPRTAIDAERLLPDMMSYDPSRPAGYPNGRLLTDHVVAHRLAFISKGEIPPDGLEPHRDLLGEFPYLGTPHPR